MTKATKTNSVNTKNTHKWKFFWEKVKNTINKQNKKKKSTWDHYSHYLSKGVDKDLVVGFFNEDDTLYAFSIIDLGIKSILEQINQNGPNIQALRNTHSALMTLQEFFRSQPIKCNPGNDPSLDKKRNKIKKSDIHKIDGNESLITLLGGDEKFVKMAIESSYFFSPEFVRESHNKLSGLLINREPLPARKGTKEDGEGSQKEDRGILYYNLDENQKILIKRDIDGNQSVRQLITEWTGYTIAKGKDSIFQNYNISHIWGRAYDPRYFTSFWNIVFIPSWANHLMDKNPPKGSIASKLKDTYMLICQTMYFKNNNNINFEQIKLDPLSLKVNHGDAIRGDYSINIINKKNGNNKVSKIEQKNITI